MGHAPNNIGRYDNVSVMRIDGVFRELGQRVLRGERGEDVVV